MNRIPYFMLPSAYSTYRGANRYIRTSLVGEPSGVISAWACEKDEAREPVRLPPTDPTTELTPLNPPPLPTMLPLLATKIPRGALSTPRGALPIPRGALSTPRGGLLPLTPLLLYTLLSTLLPSAPPPHPPSPPPPSQPPSPPPPSPPPPSPPPSPPPPSPPLSPPPLSPPPRCPPPCWSCRPWRQARVMRATWAASAYRP